MPRLEWLVGNFGGTSMRMGLWWKSHGSTSLESERYPRQLFGTTGSYCKPFKRKTASTPEFLVNVQGGRSALAGLSEGKSWRLLLAKGRSNDRSPMLPFVIELLALSRFLVPVRLYFVLGISIHHTIEVPLAVELRNRRSRHATQAYCEG